MEKIKVLCVPATGESGVIEIEPTLETFQRLVDGMIESLPACSGYANEEGILFGLPYNPTASAICNYDLFGDVVFTGGVDENGNDISVTDEFVARWFA